MLTSKEGVHFTSKEIIRNGHTLLLQKNVNGKNLTHVAGDVPDVVAPYERQVRPVLPDRGPQLDALRGAGEAPLAAGDPVAVVRLRPLYRGAHDGHVAQAGVDLALGRHVHLEKEDSLTRCFLEALCPRH